MSTDLGVAVIVVGIAALAVILLVLRHAILLRRESRKLQEEMALTRGAQQEIAGLLSRYLAAQEEKAAQDKQRQRDEALPKLVIASSAVVNGACTIIVRNLGPTASRVRMEFTPALATGATPKFDACQTGTTQQFAAQFDAGHPGVNDELRVSYTDAAGFVAAEVYGMQKTAEGVIDFQLKRRERAMWP